MKTKQIATYNTEHKRRKFTLTLKVHRYFYVSPCIFQFNNWWIPTHALFHIQHCISL